MYYIVRYEDDNLKSLRNMATKNIKTLKFKMLMKEMYSVELAQFSKEKGGEKAITMKCIIFITIQL